MASAGEHGADDNITGPVNDNPGWLHDGMIRIEVNGSKKWLAYYVDHT